MDISRKELAIVQAMSMVDGRYDEYLNGENRVKEPDKNKKFFTPLCWLNDWFETKTGYYYLGFDSATHAYMVEWRGHIESGDGKKEFIKELVVSGPVNGYLFDTVELFITAIKNHKKYFKKEEVS